MTLISPSELAAIQDLGLSGLTSTCTVYHRSTEVTANGQQNIWTAGATIPCWVYEITPTTVMLGTIDGAASLSQVFHVRVPMGSNVDSGDQLVLSTFPGNTYIVQNTNNDGTYPVWLDCAVRRVV